MTLNGCSFDGYTTSVQLFDIKGGEITNCKFNSKAVDISIARATGTVTIEGNSYTAGKTENIGVGYTDTEIANVVINDPDAKVKNWGN